MFMETNSTNTAIADLQVALGIAATIQNISFETINKTAEENEKQSYRV